MQSIPAVFAFNLRSRLANRVQITTDGHNAYLEAVEGAFGGDVDYAQLMKLYGEPAGQKGYERKYSPSECIGTRKRHVEGDPDPTAVSTSHVERHNLTMRMGSQIKAFVERLAGEIGPSPVEEATAQARAFLEAGDLASALRGLFARC